MDFAKKTAVRRSTNSKKMVLVILLLLTGVSAMSGVGIYLYKSRFSINTGIFASTFGRVKTWALERKSNLQHGVVKVKQLAQTKPVEEPQIHFEFYTALPNMQVTLPENPAQQTTQVAAGLITPAELEQELKHDL